VRAVPDHDRIEPAWRGIELTVQIATKLNRSHLVNGKAAYLLPCLGRLERDLQAGCGADRSRSRTARRASMPRAAPCASGRGIAFRGADRGRTRQGDASAEPAKVPWDAWIDDYGRIRDAIEATYPDDFRDFNARIDTNPGAFPVRWLRPARMEHGERQGRVQAALCAVRRVCRRWRTAMCCA
jgi:hypothetical protein